MYWDAVVIAGMGTVLLMVGFMAAVGWFVVRDARIKAGVKHKSRDR
ncbi:cytochrome c oxidase subunit CcoM [Marinobacter sp. M1N3S26]